MSTTVVGRAARMTGLKKPRPLRRVAADDKDMQEPNTVELESQLKRFSLIQSRAAEFMKSSQPYEDEPESATGKSLLNCQTEPTKQNFEQMTMKPPPGFQKHNIVSDTNNNIYPMPSNICPTPSTLPMSTTNSTVNNRPRGFPHPQTELKTTNRNHSSSAESLKEKGPKSFTAIIHLKGDRKDERLVLASTSMKSILKAANLLACHMNGELVYIDSSDGDSPQVNTKEKQASYQMSTPPTAFPSRPSKEQLQAHMPDLPDLVQADYGRSDWSFGCVESQHDWRFLNQSERRHEVANDAPRVKDQQALQCSVAHVQYTVKDLLMMARQPHAKLPPRNWSLIKEAFPELVAHKDRYFEPLDLKACSPVALGRSRSVEFEYRMDSMELR